MNDIPKEDEKTFDTVEHLFEDFHKEDLEWEKKHPFRAHIRSWLDKRFPNGVAGHRLYYLTPLEFFRYVKDEIEHAYQRVFRGWDDTAVWSVDYYIARLLPQLLKQLKENKSGIPMWAFDGLECEENYDYSDENTQIAEERWNEVLDKIIEGFEEYIELEDKGDTGNDSEKFKKAFELFEKYFGSFWD